MQLNHFWKNISNSRRSAPLVALSLFLAPTLLSGESSVDLRQQMDEERFQAAGLHRLTPEELTVLNLWVQQHYAQAIPTDHRGDKEAGPRQQPTGEEAFGMEQLAKDLRDDEIPEEIRSAILGDFRGWSGGTTFRLENGQVWRQVGTDRFHVRAENPVAVIHRGALGSYLLSVEGYGSRVRVRRIE